MKFEFSEKGLIYSATTIMHVSDGGGGGGGNGEKMGDETSEYWGNSQRNS